MARNNLTSRQLALVTKLRGLIANIGEACGESSSIHLDAREFANDLEWYLENRVMEEVH